VMKNEKPTMTTTVFGMSVRNATPAACESWHVGTGRYSWGGQGWCLVAPGDSSRAWTGFRAR
jgi:hypothetical protein